MKESNCRNTDELFSYRKHLAGDLARLRADGDHESARDLWRGVRDTQCHVASRIALSAQREGTPLFKDANSERFFTEAFDPDGSIEAAEFYERLRDLNTRFREVFGE